MIKLLLLLSFAFPSAVYAADFHVVVKRDAAFFANEIETQPLFEPQKREGYFTFVFVEQAGSRFHIRTLAPASPISRCYNSIAYGSSLEIDFWVESKDVMWVTPATLSKKFDDGTSFEIDAGVVLKPGAKSTEWTTDFGFQIPVSVERAKKVFRPTPTRTIGAPKLARDVAIGPTKIASLESFSDNDAADKLVTFETRCAKVVAKAGGIESKPYPIKSAVRTAKTKALHAGAELFWPSGLKAGRVEKPYPLRDEIEMKTRDQRQCVLIGGGADPPLELCVDPKSIVQNRGVQNAIGALKKGSLPHISRGEITVGPALKKEAIRRVIHKGLNKIKFCYEKELVDQPTLEGTVKVKFTIQPNGHVAKSQIAGSTLHHTKVEDCILRAIMLMKFPKPLGGGIVVVVYPFVFKPAE